jgi:hypothetical protein
MDKSKKRMDLESYFVNAYRNAWRSNVGLETKKIEAMSDRQLKESIKSLKDFAELTAKRR